MNSEHMAPEGVNSCIRPHTVPPVKGRRKCTRVSLFSSVTVFGAIFKVSVKGQSNGAGCPWQDAETPTTTHRKVLTIHLSTCFVASASTLRSQPRIPPSSRVQEKFPNPPMTQRYVFPKQSPGGSNANSPGPSNRSNVAVRQIGLGFELSEPLKCHPSYTGTVDVLRR
jgi:hypothetical protein